MHARSIVINAMREARMTLVCHADFAHGHVRLRMSASRFAILAAEHGKFRCLTQTDG